MRNQIAAVESAEDRQLRLQLERSLQLSRATKCGEDIKAIREQWRREDTAHFQRMVAAIEGMKRDVADPFLSKDAATLLAVTPPVVMDRWRKEVK